MLLKLFFNDFISFSTFEPALGKTNIDMLFY